MFDACSLGVFEVLGFVFINVLRVTEGDGAATGVADDVANDAHIADVVAHHDALAAPLSEGKVFMGLTLANVRVGALLSRVLDLCRIHGVEIDPAMATLVLSVLVLEGLGRSLDPTFNILDFASETSVHIHSSFVWQ